MMFHLITVLDKNGVQDYLCISQYYFQLIGVILQVLFDLTFNKYTLII